MHTALEWSARWPLIQDQLSGHSTVFSGHNFGESRPLHYMFSAGGAIPLPAPFLRQHRLQGLHTQELLSNSLQLLRLGGTIRMGSHWYVTLEGNVAHAADTLTRLRRENTHVGMGLTFGVVNVFTIPVELTYGKRLDETRGVLGFAMGLPF